jgi:hypothetical protein
MIKVPARWRAAEVHEARLRCRLQCASVSRSRRRRHRLCGYTTAAPHCCRPVQTTPRPRRKRVRRTETASHQNSSTGCVAATTSLQRRVSSVWRAVHACLCAWADHLIDRLRASVQTAFSQLLPGRYWFCHSNHKYDGAAMARSPCQPDKSCARLQAAGGWAQQKRATADVLPRAVKGTVRMKALTVGHGCSVLSTDPKTPAHVKAFTMSASAGREIPESGLTGVHRALRCAELCY